MIGACDEFERGVLNEPGSRSQLLIGFLLLRAVTNGFPTALSLPTLEDDEEEEDTDEDDEDEASTDSDDDHRGENLARWSRALVDAANTPEEDDDDDADFEPDSMREN